MANKILKTLEMGGVPLDVPQVTGIKGDAETNYRTGDVNITPDNLGLIQPTLNTTSKTAICYRSQLGKAVA